MFQPYFFWRPLKVSWVPIVFANAYIYTTPERIDENIHRIFSFLVFEITPTDGHGYIDSASDPD